MHRRYYRFYKITKTLLVCVYSQNATKIADDVHSFETTLNGEILYLYDYNATYNNGELFIYKGDEPQKIDDDVSSIIPVYNSKYHGNTYTFW